MSAPTDPAAVVDAFLAAMEAIQGFVNHIGARVFYFY